MNVLRPYLSEPSFLPSWKEGWWMVPAQIWDIINSWENLDIESKVKVNKYIHEITLFLNQFHNIIQDPDIEQAWRSFMNLYQEFHILLSDFRESFNSDNPSFKAVLVQLNHLIAPITHIWPQFENTFVHLPQKIDTLISDISTWVSWWNIESLEYKEVAKVYRALKNNLWWVITNISSYQSEIDRIGTEQEYQSINSLLESFFDECPDMKKEESGYTNIGENYKINSVVFKIIFDNLVSNYKKYWTNWRIFARVQDSRLSITFENDFKQDVWVVISSLKWSDVIVSCTEMLWWKASFPKNNPDKHVVKLEWLGLNIK